MHENEEIPYKSLQEALKLVKQAVQGEREDELFYDYLISKAPTKEEQDIISDIRDDERKHNKMYREIYTYFTGEELPKATNGKFEEPRSYIEGVKKAFFGELSAMERYRIIRAGMPIRYYQDMVFEILTDELKHADKYNYILNLNLEEADRMDEDMRDREKRYRGRRDDGRMEDRMEDHMEMDQTSGSKMEAAQRYEEDDSGEDEEDQMNDDGSVSLDEMLDYIYPLVYQAVLEARGGADLEELFTKYILAGALVGSGVPVEEVADQLENIGLSSR